jgi:Ca2+-binding RTX toxin-like protein
MATIFGTSSSETINAADGMTSGDDTVFAGDGNDTIRGLGGDDYLKGEDGNDTIYGGDGFDTLYGGKNEDTLYGGNDNDSLFGQQGDDHLYGENNDDYLIGGAGADTLDGGDGNDTASYVGSDAAVHVSLEPVLPAGYNSGCEAEGDILVNIENLDGSKYDDELHGNDHDNLLVGYDGNDHLYGGDGNDGLYGSQGNDVLDGGAGADHMVGGTENDTYIVDNAGDVVTELAGEGIDTVDAYINYTLGDNVEGLVLAGVGGLSGTGNDLDNAILGNDYDNLLSGGGGADFIFGLGGSDIIDGGPGADTMLGGQGFDIYIVDNAGDVVTEYAGEGVDQVQTSVSYTLAPGSEVEVLYADPATTTAPISLTGNELDNFLTGNDGINVLVGGLGVDTLRGNGGGDAFLWSSVAETSASNPDIVTDYSSAQGDVLHFTNIDADETVAGNQDFTFIGSAAFTAPGQINWFSNGTDTFIQLNTNADLAPDGIVELKGVPTGDSVLMFL